MDGPLDGAIDDEFGLTQDSAQRSIRRRVDTWMTDSQIEWINLNEGVIRPQPSANTEILSRPAADMP